MKAYDFTGVLLGMVCCAMSIFLLPAKAAAQSPSTEAALYQELRESWDDIFPTGNRNAGGAMFFKHILENYHDLNEFMIMSRFYCPVSGSFVDPAAQPAPYDAPLDHYDDDIAALEAHAGCEPRWVLPGGKMNFFAPSFAPPVS